MMDNGEIFRNNSGSLIIAAAPGEASGVIVLFRVLLSFIYLVYIPNKDRCRGFLKLKLQSTYGTPVGFVNFQVYLWPCFLKYRKIDLHPYESLTSILEKLGFSQSFLVNLASSLVSEGNKSMCGGPERSNSASSAEQSTIGTKTSTQDMNKLTIVTEDCFSSLLELAANNDAECFKRMVEQDPSAIDEVGLWLMRKKGTKQIVNEERTPLMVAATYGSVDVLKLIASLPEVDLNRTCGPSKCTALHCAMSGGAINAVNVVKLLLSAGADPNIADANGQRPVDVIVVNPKLTSVPARDETSN